MSCASFFSPSSAFRSFPYAVVVFQRLPQFFLVRQVGFLEDPRSEGLHFAGDVPALVVGESVVHVFQYPVHHLGHQVQSVHDAVHGGVEHLLVVEVHFQVGREAEFVRQVFHHRLEKRVDGLHPEAVIVVQDVAERLSRAAADFLVRQADAVGLQFPSQGRHVVVRRRPAFQMP